MSSVRSHLVSLLWACVQIKHHGGETMVDQGCFQCGFQEGEREREEERKGNEKQDLMSGAQLATFFPLLGVIS